MRAPGLAFAPPGLAALALFGLADFAPAALIGLGLAGGQRVDAGADGLDRQGDDVERGPGETAAQQQGGGEQKNHAHVQTDSREMLIWDEATKRFVDPVLPVVAPAGTSGLGDESGAALRAAEEG